MTESTDDRADWVLRERRLRQLFDADDSEVREAAASELLRDPDGIGMRDRRLILDGLVGSCQGHFPNRSVRTLQSGSSMAATGALQPEPRRLAQWQADMEPAVRVLTQFARREWVVLLEWLVSWGRQPDRLPACGLVAKAMLKGGGPDAIDATRTELLARVRAGGARWEVAWLGMSGTPEAVGLLREVLPEASEEARPAIEQALAALDAAR